MSLKLLLLFAIEKGVHKLQIFGDSKIVINWFNDNSRCHMHTQYPIIEEINLFKQYLDHITCFQICRERNLDADSLSKEDVAQNMGTWKTS